MGGGTDKPGCIRGDGHINSSNLKGMICKPGLGGDGHMRKGDRHTDIHANMQLYIYRYIYMCVCVSQGGTDSSKIETEPQTHRQTDRQTPLWLFNRDMKT